MPPSSTVAPDGGTVAGKPWVVRVTVPLRAPALRVTVTELAVAVATVPVTSKLWPTAGGTPVHETIVTGAAPAAAVAGAAHRGDGAGAGCVVVVVRGGPAGTNGCPVDGNPPAATAA